MCKYTQAYVNTGFGGYGTPPYLFFWARFWGVRDPPVSLRAGPNHFLRGVPPLQRDLVPKMFRKSKIFRRPENVLNTYPHGRVNSLNRRKEGPAG